MTKETEQILDKLTELAETLKSKPRYGIRSKETGDLIMMNTIGDKFVYTESKCNFRLWFDKALPERLYEICAGVDDHFKNTYFVDKATEEELEQYYKVQMYGISMKGE